MAKPTLNKPLDIDACSPTILESNETTLTISPSTTSAQNDVSAANFQNELAETPLNCQTASASNPVTDQDSTFDKVVTEEQAPQEEQEPKKSKNFRITAIAGAKVDAENDGDQEDTTNWDATSHWRKMIRKQERRMYKGKTNIAESGSFTGSDTLEHRLVTFIKGHTYENAGIMLVVINAIFIGWQVEHKANTNTNLLFQEPIEIVFAFLFTVEFIGKAIAWGRSLFNFGPENRDLCWNIFDVIVVSFMWLEIAMELQVIPTSNVQNVSILRILRVLRLVRVVKVLRTLKFFRDLRLMILAISKGSFCLVWVIGVLGTAFYLFGVSLTQGANDLCPGSNYKEGGHEELKNLCENFGTLPMSILSLYAAMSGGISWVELFHALTPLGPMYLSIFLFYTCFSIFAVSNIITGIFVDSAMHSSKNDQDSVVDEEMLKLEEYVSSIYQVFMALDQDESGTIGVHEFEQVVKSDEMAAYFNALGLEITDVKSLSLPSWTVTGQALLTSRNFLWPACVLKARPEALI